MKFCLIRVGGSSSPPWLKLAMADWIKKIAPLIAIEDVSIKSPRKSRERSGDKTKAEARSLAEFIKPDDYVVLFDEVGRALNSIQFSKQLELIMNSSKKRAVFIIGGPYGFDESTRDRAQLILSLSALTLNHHVAAAVALEQIYRGLAIRQNLPYHND